MQTLEQVAAAVEAFFQKRAAWYELMRALSTEAAESEARLEANEYERTLMRKLLEEGSDQDHPTPE